MSLFVAFEIQGNTIFKTQWTSQNGEKIFGDCWAVVLSKEESNRPVFGPKQKKTHALVFVLDRNGNVQQTQFDACSRSWVDNLHDIYPKINAWVLAHSGVNPNLS